MDPSKCRNIAFLLLLLAGVSSCSIVLPRAPGQQEHDAGLTMVWSPGLFTKGRATIAQNGAHLQFAKRNSAACHVFFPGVAINASATCTDGTTAKVKFYWTNGHYQGRADLSDGTGADFSDLPA